VKTERPASVHEATWRRKALMPVQQCDAGGAAIDTSYSLPSRPALRREVRTDMALISWRPGRMAKASLTAHMARQNNAECLGEEFAAFFFR